VQRVERVEDATMSAVSMSSIAAWLYGMARAAGRYAGSSGASPGFFGGNIRLIKKPNNPKAATANGAI
jgi:hypothetical protein